MAFSCFSYIYLIFCLWKELYNYFLYSFVSHLFFVPCSLYIYILIHYLSWMSSSVFHEVFWLHFNRESTGEWADPRDPYTQTGPSPGGRHQWRKGLLSCSRSSPVISLQQTWQDIKRESPCLLFFRKTVSSPSPLTLWRTCFLFCERGVCGPLPHQRTLGSQRWPCSAWRPWFTSCTPAVLQNGR